METNKQRPALATQDTLGTARFRSYAPLLEKFGIPFTIQNPWLIIGKLPVMDKWVICIPLTIRHAEEILHAVIPVLKQSDVAFHLIADQLQHNRINNHAFPLQLFGKPLLIFPKDDGQASALATTLSNLTKQYQGLLLPDSIRLGSIVYATYCTVNQIEENTEPEPFPISLGLQKDNPSGPFPISMRYKSPGVKRFIKNRYLPIAMISSTHKGNILKAVDIFRFRWCFIKQAKAWAGEDIHGRQMRNRLQWQKQVSQHLEPELLVPRLYDLTEQDGYTYLITEYIAGSTLDAFIKSESSDFQVLLRIYLKALLQLKEMHRMGYIHRDMTAKNIILENSGKVFLTDLELAYPIAETTMVPFDSGTIGYMSSQQTAGTRPAVSDDVFTCGALLYYLASREHPRELNSLSEHERNERIDALQISANLKEAIKMSIEKKQESRYMLSELIDSVRQDLIEQKTEASEIPVSKNRISAKKKIALSGLLVILAFLTVFVLWKTSDEPNTKNNGFVRTFISKDLKPIAEIALPIKIISIAGLIGDSLYFATVTPGEIAKLNVQTQEWTKEMFIQDSLTRAELSNATILQVDKWGIALFDGTAKLIFTRSWSDKTVKVQSVAEPFTRAVRFSTHSVAMRKFKTGEKEQYFSRYDLNTNTILHENLVTEPLGDAGLVTSGYLDFDEQGHGIYVTRYANHIYSLDSNMNTVRRGTTIDTFSNFTLDKSKVINKKVGMITNDGPPHVINKSIAVADRKIYIYSLVRADNVPVNQFITNNVIDVYRVNGLKYFGSFSIPTKDKNRIHEFTIKHGNLYALYKDALRVYSLPEID